MNAPRAVFRADASPEVGTGHVMRCLTLANALAHMGWRSTFVSCAGTAASVPALGESSHGIIELAPEESGDPAALSARFPEGRDLLVVDHYGLDHAFESACRPWARRILVIDDLADRIHDCDVLLDQNLGHSAEDYRDRLAGDCVLLLGPGYALLRPQFARARRDALAGRDRQGAAKRILVTLGGTDSDNVTVRILEGIARSGLSVEVDVAMGAAAPHLREVKDFARTLPLPVRVHGGVSDMAALMVEADLCVGAAGATTWERCCLGLPTVIVVIAENQRPVAAPLEKLGAALLLGEADMLAPDDIGHAVARLAADRGQRHTMARSAAALCDGLGAARTAAAVAADSVARDGRSVHLRMALQSDAGIMLEWQSDPRTRRFFRNPEPPKADEHVRWVSRRLSDPDCIFNIIMYGNEPAGVLRLDRKRKAEAYEISILVAPALHGRGIARTALDLARRMLPGAEFRAEVMPDNVRSVKLFTSAGYTKQNGVYVSLPSDGIGAEQAAL